MYAKISNKHLQGKNESQHTLNNVGVLWLYASAMDLYCGCGQRWSSSLIILHSKCPSVNIGSYYKEIGMYLPGSPRGFWIELENPKIREIKKNYLHKYSLFVVFSFLGSLSPPLQEREPYFPVDDLFYTARVEWPCTPAQCVQTGYPESSISSRVFLLMVMRIR